MRTKLVILTFAVSALLAVICYGRMKRTDLNKDSFQDTLPFGEFVDPRSVSLRGRRALGPHEVVTLPGNNQFAIDGQMDNMLLQSKKVSYVTSFWAQESGTQVDPHRLEIRASLLANILNPHFDQVVIFLDSVKENANCDLFLRGMKELSRTLTNIPSFPTTSVNHDDLHSKVTCVGSPDGQPNYYQMFQNAVSDYVTGDIVVLANADQAFDDTMALARHLNPEVLITLATRGYSDLIPPSVDSIYKQVVGRVHPEYMTASNERVKAPDVCITVRCSIDTWIFHKSKLKETLRPEPFQRPIKGGGGGMEFFFMNMMQAENAAVWALNQCYRFQSYYHACEKIHSWHFHLTKKTHHRGKTGGSRVSPPWNPPFPSKTPRCVNEMNCFL